MLIKNFKKKLNCSKKLRLQFHDIFSDLIYCTDIGTKIVWNKIVSSVHTPIFKSIGK